MEQLKVKNENLEMSIICFILHSLVVIYQKYLNLEPPS